ncbi:HlyD family secretion protein [Budviciaceae bacterium CWB-B4]|uniref:HlyD family secretion protein n=1 Tax=Limnobaculum xujianqingii TaxID=2738837 RepID=A0A9D7FY83_9GAMM|nr:HlyD family secretion protein [Limnobaculum xujianqingii]MBK5073518.1 HlyD family secretion protein [Limnobaculum xujianqingii]MBK5176751.1 HlyD family secretion protein [Limnobaculum xujianqingii]
MEKRRLFRQEAIEHQKAKWTGTALLVTGYPAWIIACASTFFIIVLVVSLTFGNYTRRINVNGEIVTQPRAINIFAPQQGFISKLLVDAGVEVTKGTALYQLDVSRIARSGNVTIHTTEAIEKQLVHVEGIITKLEKNKQATQENIKQQIAQSEAANKKSQFLVNNAAKGVEEMRQSMKNYEEYQRQGLVNKEQFNNQRYLYYQQQSSYQALNTQIIQENLKIGNLQSELTTSAADFDNQIAQYQYQLNELQRQLTEADAAGMLIINAPSDGKIESLSVTEGQMVNPGDSLAQLIPTSINAYYLVLWLPNNSLPYVSPGDRINIRYDAFPYQKFGQFPGTVQTVSAVPASIQEMSTYSSAPRATDGGTAQSYYKVIVALDSHHFMLANKELRLTSGMRAQTTLFLEKRPLYQWMLSPFYDIKKSITGPVNG